MLLKLNLLSASDKLEREKLEIIIKNKKATYTNKVFTVKKQHERFIPYAQEQPFQYVWAALTQQVQPRPMGR